ncbi:hypothetical protein AYI70_g1128 [Smittium culicis]|uniref:Uncharacterized protein n=1 Tax=Smittium culicis TaxID=133412 RepID=A0A1R1YDV1_9FUNG|nr:hypothetical protein AYI70_g1128 [Smittium culicis]
MLETVPKEATVETKFNYGDETGSHLLPPSTETGSKAGVGAPDADAFGDDFSIDQIANIGSSEISKAEIEEFVKRRKRKPNFMPAYLPTYVP